jgi:adenylosuccinate synthase
VLDKAEPVLEEMPGWNEPITAVRKFSELPSAAQKYVQRIEKLLDTEIILVSVGPGREQTILLKNPFDS